MPRARHACLALALVATVLHFARFDVPERPIVTDVRYYVYFATRVVDGAVPHRDYFDNKPQLATFAGALFQKAGAPLGLEPLRAMRLGFLALAGLLSLLLFAAHRALAGGDCVAGLLGLTCSLGFPLLGLLPSIGPVPKLLITILALAAGLLALRGRWLAAGFAGALAALDWQIGALAGIGVLVAACCERVERKRSCIAVAYGGLAALLLFVVYFGAHGALGAAVEQLVGSALARGTSSGGHGIRVHAILEALDLSAPGMRWLAWAGVAGMALYPLWIVRLRDRPAGRLAIVLAVYGYGVVAFSVLDFQGFGDLLVLLAVMAFFAGVAVVEGYTRARALLERRAQHLAPAAVARRATRFAVVVVATLALLVGAFRNPVAPLPPSRVARPGLTLDDQREVAQRLAALARGRKTIFAGCAEQLYLTGVETASRFVYWNSATLSYFGGSPDEKIMDALERVLRAAEPDVIVCARPKAHRQMVASGDFEGVRLESPDGRYHVWVALAQDEATAERRGG